MTTLELTVADYRRMPNRHTDVDLWLKRVGLLDRHVVKIRALDESGHRLEVTDLHRVRLEGLTEAEKFACSNGAPLPTETRVVQVEEPIDLSWLWPANETVPGDPAAPDTNNPHTEES